MRRVTAGVLAAGLLGAAQLGGQRDGLAADLEARRARAMEALGPSSMLILFSAPTRVYSHDVEYEYRQDHYLYYLTGIAQDETTLVLMPGNRERRAILFVKPRDPEQEHWEGRILSHEQARETSGIQTIYPSSELEPFLNAVLSGDPYDLPRYIPNAEYDAFFAALKARRAEVALVLDRKPELYGPLGPVREFAARIRERFPEIQIRDATDLLGELRRIKTPYERDLLRRSVEISAEAHLAGMRAARPGAYEYQVEAAIEQVFLARGASGWGYPSIVGSGPNATILHYTTSTRRMAEGDLLLVDAAASYQYMTGDITRTYPVSGTFSPDQRAIYAIVEEAQEEARKVAQAGTTPAGIHQRAVEVVSRGLARLGLIANPASEEYRTWFTHGTVHYIGMDVHDVGSSSAPLEPGVAFVIEPGIYIRAEALDHLEPTDANRAFIERVRPAVEQYDGIGVRIEDSFLLTEAGLERLSERVPRTLEEIERFMRARPAATP